MTKMKYIVFAFLLAFVLSEAAAKSTKVEVPEKEETVKVEAKAAAEEVPEEGDEEVEQRQYPFRDLPADVLRDFPGLCFGSTALRLFHIGQSWSLTPFCGVATCLVSVDGKHLIERVQDCGPQPKKNPKCKNVNENSEEQFPYCCPVFECEEGEELEYPTQEELQALAHEAAQAAVRAQYEQADEVEKIERTGKNIKESENKVSLTSSAADEIIPDDLEVLAKEEKEEAAEK